MLRIMCMKLGFVVLPIYWFVVFFCFLFVLFFHCCLVGFGFVHCCFVALCLFFCREIAIVVCGYYLELLALMPKTDSES